ncbi:MAG: nicotinate-nucleotide diphosphorylase (carboxylating) [Rickettsiales bacterium]|nr:nicotinate-nucleotide diphosphorylase (carboxylating) [Rickettsiales bacterium]
MLPTAEDIQRVIMAALKEDFGSGDITSAVTIPPGAQSTMHLVAREPMVVAGLDIAATVFQAVDPNIDISPRAEDAQWVEAGSVLCSINGSVHGILAAERTALNLLQRMCGIATLTAQFVKAVQGTGASILDTRKTVPGLRSFDKYAVTCGGGRNHRMRLDDAVLIKDNHLAVVGSVQEAVTLARASVPVTMEVQVECDTLAQVDEAVAAGADAILLDNMSIDQLREAVSKIGGRARSEASGGVSLQTVRAIAETGVDCISIGALTHSVSAADIGLDSVA